MKLLIISWLCSSITKYFIIYFVHYLFFIIFAKKLLSTINILSYGYIINLGERELRHDTAACGYGWRSGVGDIVGLRDKKEEVTSGRVILFLQCLIALAEKRKFRADKFMA